VSHAVIHAQSALMPLIYPILIVEFALNPADIGLFIAVTPAESPVLQAYLADRASGPIRDMAFAIYFTIAFGIGAFWALVIGNVITAFGYPVAFSVMAASYLAAAGLLLAVRAGRQRGVVA
jgi:MFS family permease